MTITLSDPLYVHNTLSIDGEQHGVKIDGGGGRMFRLTHTESDLSLFNMHLLNGVGGGGPAVYVQHQTGKFTATQVKFSGNMATSDGGAISTIGRLQLTDVQFEDNHSGGDGGAIFAGNGDAFLTAVTFTDNTAQGNGGAMAISSTDGNQQNVALVAVNFDSNTAYGSAHQQSGGGALWLDNEAKDEPNVRFLQMLNTFNNNQAPNGNGGAMLVTLGSEIHYPDGPELEDVLTDTLPGLAQTLHPFAVDPDSFDLDSFDLNTLLDGGLLVAEGLYSVHFSGNQAPNGSGGAIYNRGRISVLSSSFQGNTSGQFGGAVAHDTNNHSNFLTLANATFLGNHATVNGSAVANPSGGRVELIHDTLAYNGGNSAVYSAGSGAHLSARNTLLAANANHNCVGPIDADTSNLQYAPASGCGSAWSADPELFPAPIPGVGLMNVVTVLPFLDGGAANGAGDWSVCQSAPIFGLDARGFPFTRPGLMEPGNTCDIGAYESTGTVIQSHGLDFGRVAIGNSSTKKAVLLNDRDHSLAVDPAIGWSSYPVTSSPFSIVSDDCGVFLHSGESCTVEVRFAPTKYGEANGTLVLWSAFTTAGRLTARQSIDDISLTGVGYYRFSRTAPTLETVPR